LSPQKALRLWHDVALTRVRGNIGDLTERQMLILLTIYLENPPTRCAAWRPSSA
jgi:hypothetical protein